VLEVEGVTDGELGISFVTAEESRRLKKEHLEIDEATDVLSFPIDGLDTLPSGVPRALGDLVLCPEIVREEWQWPLVHGLLHLLGYEHSEEMDARERAHLGAIDA
jgi:probable rRNA maturation factor